MEEQAENEWVDFSTVSPCEELTGRLHDILLKWGIVSAGVRRAEPLHTGPVEAAKLEFEGRTLKISWFRPSTAPNADGTPTLHACAMCLFGCWRLV